MRIPLACCLLSCVLDVDLFIFSSLPSLFTIEIWTTFVSSCGYYAVISSRRYTPPRARCESEVCAFPLRAVFFLAFLMLIYFFFLLFLPFFRFRFGHRFSFCGYYAVSSVSVSAATHLAYDMYLDTYVH